MDTLISGPVTDGSNVYFADSAGIEAVSLVDGSTAATLVTLVPDTCNTMGVFGARRAVSEWSRSARPWAWRAST